MLRFSLNVVTSEASDSYRVFCFYKSDYLNERNSAHKKKKKKE